MVLVGMVLILMVLQMMVIDPIVFVVLMEMVVSMSHENYASFGHVKV